MFSKTTMRGFAFIYILGPALGGFGAIYNPVDHLCCLGLPPFVHARGQTARMIQTRGQSGIARDASDAAATVMQMLGVRNICLSFGALAAMASGGDSTYQDMVLASAALYLLDGFISRRRVGPGAAWQHWVFVAVGGGIAVGLAAS
ncbi:DUF4267 domain-containing protein [Microdochium nivale]|nr:DUF4267 domain-containing protein [Microdochium nivale]